MLRPFTAEEFRQDGLLPFHFQFAEQFSKPDSPRYWRFVTPPGIGTSNLAAHLADRELSAPDPVRILILVPPGLTLQWRERLAARTSDVQPIIVDRKKFLELQAEAPQGCDLWPQRAVVVMSIDLAKRRDIRASIVSTVWNLVIVGESHVLTGHRLDLFARMVDANCMTRAVLLSNTPNAGVAGVQSYQLSRNGLVDWSGSSLFAAIKRDVYCIPYDRSDEEARFISRLEDVCRVLVESFTFAGFQRDIILRAASSALYTVETSLRRLVEGWRPVRNKLAHGMSPSMADLFWIQLRLETVMDEISAEPDAPEGQAIDPGRFLGVFSAVEGLLESIDDIAVDSKLEALLRYLQDDRELGTQHLCVLTSFKATAEYLSSSLSLLQAPRFCITGLVDPSSRTDIVREFERSHGILIATDAALEGMHLDFVDRCISYDTPVIHAQTEQRWGRFSGHGAVQMAVMRDRSKSFEWEDKLLTNFLRRSRR